MASEPEQQPAPETPLFCPDCGAELDTSTEDLLVEHRLSAMGYLHDDQVLTCPECGSQSTHGVPVGEFEGGLDLECRSCRHDPSLEQPQFYRVHRVVWQQGDQARLHLKCPRCFHFRSVERERDNRGVALVGYPDITGSTEGADPYGWHEDPPTLEGDG